MKSQSSSEILKRGASAMKMKNILTALAACAMAILLPVQTSCAENAAEESADMTAGVRSLCDYLLTKPAAQKPDPAKTDSNQDGILNAADFSMMKQALLPQTQPAASKTLVAYFSRTNNTEKIADDIVELTGAERYEMSAKVPYSDADIRYQDSECRANQEQNDKDFRTEIAEMPENLDAYDTIFLGYPIWWGEEPRIIDTFLEAYDFSEKTVIPFCTSGSSGIGQSEKRIASLVPIGRQLTGRRFAASASKDSVSEWMDSLDPAPQEQEVKSMQITVNGKTLTASIADNEAGKALAELLGKGDLTLSLSEYGGFEKVGALPQALPKSDTQIKTEAGDIMLYQGNQMTIFYGSNSWSYTPLGKIEYATAAELKEIFGTGDVTVKLSPVK